MFKPVFKSSIYLILLTLLALPTQASATSGEASLIEWQSWDKDLFARAREQQRMIILDLDAVWCHWCHVMEEKTYRNHEVAKLINQHFIAVRVDADANPDIASRYGRWGWPATIVFTADGNEIVKRRGYIPAIGMLSMLEAIIKDPSPGPSVWHEPKATPAGTAALDDELRDKMQRVYFDIYDAHFGGWGRIHRFVNSPAIEYAIEQARLGQREHELMARLTLHNGLQLIDPVWGGVYQYSDQLDWRSPHYEKIMFYQAENLRLYSLAYARWQDPAYLEAMNSIHSNLVNFLLDPEGGFFTSQDADLNLEVDGHAYFPLDDAGRRALGLPRIDNNIYARENGWVIGALLGLYAANENATALEQALAATEFVIQHRRLANGGFSHGANDIGGPYLADNQSMAQAFIALYRATGDRRWLDELTLTLEFIEASFKNAEGGYNSATAEPASVGVFAEPTRLVEEIAALARTANLAAHYLGTATPGNIADHAMRYLAAPELSELFIFQPAILLADYELNNAPAHITIVGAKQDAQAAALYAAARAFPGSYLRLNWWDRSEGALPNANVVYPQLEKAAAFVCSDNACSRPLFDAAEIAPMVEQLYAVVD
jgi:uncharacterized protein YyaL (SSP411 family)